MLSEVEKIWIIFDVDNSGKHDHDNDDPKTDDHKTDERDHDYHPHESACSFHFITFLLLSILFI